MRSPRRPLALLGLWALLGAGPALAEQPYWTCRDATGARVVQDVPCAEAPHAPPSGVAREPMRMPPPGFSEDRSSGDLPRQQPRSGEVDSLGWWQRQGTRLWGWIGDTGRWRQWLSQPWVWWVSGAIGVLWLARLAWSRARTALAARRLQREAERQPDPYRRILRERVRSAQTLPSSGEAVAARDVTLERPPRWSMEAIRALPADRFETLCLQLWRWQGLRVAPDLRTETALCLALRNGRDPERLQALVWCQVAARIGAATVRELFGLMTHYGCERAVIMTTGDFDPGARDFARGKPIELKGALTLATEIDALTDGQRRNLLDAVYGPVPSVPA